jgi:hypothetical protein
VQLGAHFFLHPVAPVQLRLQGGHLLGEVPDPGKQDDGDK